MADPHTTARLRTPGECLTLGDHAYPNGLSFGDGECVYCGRKQSQSRYTTLATDLAAAQKALRLCASAAGHYDPEQACRNIIAIVKDALASSEVPATEEETMNVTGCTCPTPNVSTGKEFAHEDYCPTRATILLTPGGAMSGYDSRPETQAHIGRVRHFVNLAVENLVGRAERHDASKLVSPEVEAFDIATPKLAGLVYGSEEYRQSLRDLGPALKHHFEQNDHHPEHYENGVRGMSLMALIEMLCDWRAASERVKQRTDDPEKVKTFEAGLAYNQERFGYSDELAEILLNTIRELEGSAVPATVPKEEA